MSEHDTALEESVAKSIARTASPLFPGPFAEREWPVYLVPAVAAVRTVRAWDAEHGNRVNTAADSSARETCNEARIGEIVANLEGGQSLLINRIGRDMWRVTVRDGLNHVSSIGEAPTLHDALAGARIP